MSTITITAVHLRTEHDLAVVRAATRLISEALGLSTQDTADITAAVWAIAHNALAYARDAQVDFFVYGNSAPHELVARVQDRGPGMRAPQELVDRPIPPVGSPGGIACARRLVDRFWLTTDAKHGTTVLLTKRLPPERRPDRREIEQVYAAFEAQRPRELIEQPYADLNELLVALVHRRLLQDQLKHFERGREPAEPADAERRRAATLTIVLPEYVRHEAARPLNSILMLCRLLIERTDGALTPEQERQIVFIREASEQMLELVTELAELGHLELAPDEPQPAEIVVAELCQVVQGHLTPNLRKPGVRLIFDQPGAFPALRADPAKLVRILVGVLGFALRRTDRGEVRLAVEFMPEQDTVCFTVEDSGPVFSEDERKRVFADFLELLRPPPAERAPLGLALPLARRLLERLGGRMVLARRDREGESIRMILPRNPPGSTTA
jgi:signal transduction histidine kinase